MHDALQLRCIDFFRDGIVEQKNLTQSIIDGACDILAAYREGQEMDSHTFAEAVAMFYQIHVYTTMFEPRMLELSQSYIAAWANKESHAKSLPEYVKAAHALIQTETSRADAFKLSPSTKTALTTLLYDLVISKQETRLSKLP
jgi:cullin-4